MRTRQILLFAVVGLLIALLLILSTCKKRIEPPTPEQLYEKYRKAVVMIRHSYYYRIDFGNDFSCYAIQRNGKPSIVFDESEAKEKANTIYGTGFFVSKDGQIITNRHVVEPKIDEGFSDSLRNLKDVLNAWSFVFQQSAIKTQDSAESLRQYLYKNSYSIQPYEASKLRQNIDELNLKAEKAINAANQLRINSNNVTITTVTTFLGIAYDNSFVNSIDDFKGCVVVKKPIIPDIDLSVIQLTDKTTPSTVDNIFTFDDHNPNIANHTAIKGDTFDINKPLPINEKVYMIGFNYGYELANTSNGIKSQFTQGTVSQESDNSRVLYSIPALEGSSGSPIIDQWGNLVAVNFAKISNSQSFTFGIPSKYSKRVLEEGTFQLPIAHIEISSSYATPYIPPVENTVSTESESERLSQHPPDSDEDTPVYGCSPINKDPDISSPIIKSACDDKVKIFYSYNSDFYYVRCQGFRGFLAKKWVK